MNAKNILKNPSHFIKTERLKFCELCFIQTKKVIPCAKCKIHLCKGCVTYINDVPFCNDCVVNIVRNKTKLMILSGDLVEEEEEDEH